MTALSFAVAPVNASDNIEALELEGVAVWKTLPRPSEMIRHPSAESFEVYGARKPPKLVKAKGVPGEEAMEVKVAGEGKNPWSVGANVPAQLPTKAGDVLSVTIWARATKLPKGQTSTPLPIAVQEQGGSYQQFGNATAKVTGQWQRFTVYGTLPTAYDVGDIGAAVHLATGKQTIQLGPIFMMNLGPGAVSASEMPRNAPKASAADAPIVLVKPIALPAELKSDYAKIKAQLGANGTLISQPYVTAGDLFGDGTKRIVSDAGVPGGKAIEVTVKTPGLNSWSTGVNWRTTGTINPNDVVLLAYWAKGISAQNEAQTPAISPARVQQSVEPFAAAAVSSAFLSRDWQLYYASGIASDVIAPGESGVSFHMGNTKQVLRLGPTYVINLGPNASVEDLPQTKITYVGREATAPWRAEAMARIDRYRKADMTIRVTDASGAPVVGVPVKVEMKKHAFNFGTFVNHRYTAPRNEEERRWHKVFDANFNIATLPMYWQDWGWNGDKAQDYRDTIEYASAKGVTWRGHPILWPGEGFMPSSILENKGRAKTQRQQVLDHVRDQMNYIKDKNPIAVDMVNEVRVNQYFIENGNPGLVAESFKLAHQIAPDIPLFVNDYGVLNNGGLNTKAIEFYHDWIKGMRRQGVPVGGIGFQSHFSAGLTPPAQLADILSGFGEYGLPMHVTEFDIETLDEQAQAEYTRDFILTMFAEPQMEAFVMWGFYEGSHWKKAAAMIREDWSKKPNYEAWRKVVFDTLWTDETVMTDANGVAQLRGFRGDYIVSARGVTATASVAGATEIDLKL